MKILLLLFILSSGIVSGDSLPSVIPNWSASTILASTGFGYSVSNAGDVNGDGFDDVIVGSPFYKNGRAEIFFGSPSGLSAVPKWTVEGTQTDGGFGTCVSSAGDVNGDGFDDVIVGAPSSHTLPLLYTGKIFVYYGSDSGLSITPNWSASSNQYGSQFGLSISSAGDVNNDGFDDIISGAPLYDNGQSDEGKVFVWYGSASGLGASGTPGNADWSAESNQAKSFFGTSVSSAGDVNNNGCDDIIIGASTYDNPSPYRDQGAAFVYYGSPSGLSLTENWKSNNQQTFFTFFGTSVSTAGDVNGDGYSDVIIGATGFDSWPQTDEGKAYVYYGSASGLPLSASWSIESFQAYATLGNSVSSAGDVNGDGYSDIIIGANRYDQEGNVFVFRGSAAGLTDCSSWGVSGNYKNAYLGNSVSSAGDVNGDGYSDILIGSYLFKNTGAAFCYYGFKRMLRNF